jgi:hypothetical protein
MSVSRKDECEEDFIIVVDRACLPLKPPVIPVNPEQRPKTR